MQDGSEKLCDCFNISGIPLSISEVISILSYFVAGCNIHASEIPKNVLGISAGSVIFSSVAKPMLPPLNESQWRVSNQLPFNGKAEDAFGAISMHLSFTDWKQPITGVADQGNRDAQYSKMESVISIREQGKWVGDVDISPALNDPRVYEMATQEPCDHPKDHPPRFPMVSIECWDELRDLPAGKVVVRAHGNWLARLARLAATTYLVQCAQEISSGIERITVCPPSVCWLCVEKEFQNNVFVY